MPSVYFVSLGCPKNRVDTEVMLGHLQRHGYHFAAEPHTAELIVVNTCAFIDPAKQESIDAIIEMGEHKVSGACRTLVVAGCLSQRHAPALKKAMPEVDHFLGTGNFETIAQLVANGDTDAANDAQQAPDWSAEGSARLPLLAEPPAARGEHPRLRGPHRLIPYAHPAEAGLAAIPDPDFTITARSPRQRTQPAFSSYVKVSEGCNNTCAFCIIPKLRGPQRSRPIADIVEEARRLIGEGAVELNLIAQDLCAYGRDLRPRAHLADLLAALDQLGETSGRPLWIRCLYAYPKGLGAETIDVLAQARHIVPYLDMPLQHISDRMLRRMRRGAGEEHTRTLIATLRARVARLTLRTTLIAGMPGETEEEFFELLQFVKDTRFERLGVFAYSQEEDTPAAQMPEQVPWAIRQQRRKAIMQAQRRISRAHQRALRGQVLDVLVAGKSEQTDLLLVGRHAGQAPDIDGVSYISGGVASPGEVVQVRVEQTLDYDVSGPMVSFC